MYLAIIIIFLTFLPRGAFMFELQSVKKEIDIKGFHTIYYFEFGKNFTHSPEMHNFWEMVYVDSGKIIAITDGVGCSLKQGEIIFHEPMEVHSHVSDKETPNNMLVISFSTDSEAMQFFSKKTFTADKTVRTLLSLFIDEAKNALGEIPSEYENTSPLDFSSASFGSMQLLSCYFTEILIRLIRGGTEASNKIAHTEKSRAIAQSSLSELVINFMQANLYNSISLGDICEHFMIGKSHLSSIFKATTGSSIMDYYSTLKIAEAKKLIRCDDYSISQISDMLGFSCIHTFSRAFKNAVGFSPTDYKKRLV